MKAKYQIILLLLICFNVFKVIGQKPTSTIIFMGYHGDIPVFNEVAENNIYIYDGKEFVYKAKYSENYEFKLVEKDLYFFQVTDQKGNIYAVLKRGLEGEEKRYKIESSILYSTSDGDNIYFTDKNGHIKTLSTDGVISNTRYKGEVLGFAKGCLYFSKVHDDDLPYANADIFELDILVSTSSPKKIITNVSGEATFVFPDGKYIFEKVLMDGEFKPFIFDIKGNRRMLVNINNKFLNTNPFFVGDKERLVFYISKTLETEFLDVEEFFNR